MSNKPLDPVIDKFIAAFDQSDGGIRGTILEIKIKGVLVRWLNKEYLEITRAIQADLLPMDREEFWVALRNGYCRHCARKLESGGKCLCENFKSLGAK